MRWIDDVAEELGHLGASARKLRRFGVELGLVGVAMGGLAFARGHAAEGGAVVAAALALTATGLARPLALRRSYRAWMAIALALGWVVSRAVLTALYFLVVTPLAIARRLLARRPPPTEPETYWTKRDPGRRVRYDKMY